MAFLPLGPGKIGRFVAFALAVVAVVRPLAAVNVTVDATQVLRTIDDRMFGANTAVWDGAFKNVQTLPLIQAAELRALRFPGGSTSDTYDWQTNRSYQSGTRTLNNWSWTNTFDEFAQVALTVRAEVFITVNYGSGTAQQAADWVRYSNVTKGYGFKYWEVGNECYGSWEEDIHPLKWDPVTYANEAKDYIALMKAVDPTIKIGVVVQSGDSPDSKAPPHTVTNPRTGATQRGWTAVMLDRLHTLGVTPDYVIYHRYPLAPGSETDVKLLSGVSISNTTWADDARDLRQQVNDFLGAAGAGVELLVTENNDVYSEPGKQSTSLVNGLFLADSFGQLLQTEFKGFVWWALHNGPPKDDKGNLLGNFSSSLYGWRTYGDYGMLSQSNDPHPTYYAMKLLSHFARASDSVVKATSAAPLLATYAVKRADGSLTLLVVNKDPSATQQGSFTLTGFAAGGTATVYSYGIPQDDAARTGTGARDLATSTLSGLGTSFQASFAPYSMTVIALAPATPSVPAQFAGFPSGSAGATLTWQPPSANTGGLSGYVLERATDVAFTQNRVTVTLGTSTSYVDAGLAPSTRYFYRLAATNAAGTSPKTDAVAITTLGADATGTARLVNISARARCGTGNSVTAGGFVVAGTKKVLVRAVGPTLRSQGIGATELLADPTIELYNASARVRIGNFDNWGDEANAAEIPALASSLGAAALLADDTRSSAVLQTVSSGVYTFLIKGRADTSGIVLLEVYDAGGDGKFMNISARADGGTGNNVAIGGFVINGNGPKRVLMRAVGPTLTQQGIGEAEVMRNPFIELHDASHGNVVIATNDNWPDNANAADVVTTGARIGATPFAETDRTSSALLVSLPPGVYSFFGRGQADSTGIVLIEIYDAD
jgi:hypothetical protein